MAEEVQKSAYELAAAELLAEVEVMENRVNTSAFIDARELLTICQLARTTAQGVIDLTLEAEFPNAELNILDVAVEKHIKHGKFLLSGVDKCLRQAASVKPVAKTVR